MRSSVPLSSFSYPPSSLLLSALSLPPLLSLSLPPLSLSLSLLLSVLLSISHIHTRTDIHIISLPLHRRLLLFSSLACFAKSPHGRKRHVLLWNKNVATSNAITRAARAAPERGCCARLGGERQWRWARGQEGRNGVSGRTRRGDEVDEARGMFVLREDSFGEEGRRGNEWVAGGWVKGWQEKGGRGRLSGGWRIAGGRGEGEVRERESRGWARFCEGSERWLGWNVHVCVRVRARACVCVHDARTRACVLCTYAACRVSHRGPVCVRTCVRESLARASDACALARVHAREKSILAVRRVQIVDTSYEPVTPEVRASVNYYYREFRQSIIVKQFPPSPPPPPSAPLPRPCLLFLPFLPLVPFAALLENTLINRPPLINR